MVLAETRVRIASHEIPLHGDEPCVGRRRERLVVASAVRETEQRQPFLWLLWRAGEALAGGERGPGASIGGLGQDDLLAERLFLGVGQVEMPQAMAADLEQWIGDQLLRAFGMGLHPFAAGEECRLYALRAQGIDDAAVIT